VLAAVPLALVGLAITAAVLARGSPGGLGRVSANSVGIIDPATDHIVAEIPVGIRPGPIAAGTNSLWVGNLEDRTLMRIDPRRRRVVATISLENRTPTGIAVGARAVWVAHGLRGLLSRVDPQFKQVTPIEVTHSLGDRQFGAVTYGSGSVWAVYGDSTLARVDPLSRRIRDSSFAGTAPAALAVYAGAVWVANSEDATVQRFNAVTLEPVKTFGVGRRPIAITAGEGALWVANSGAGSVTRIDPSGDNTQIPVGAGPSAVAVGAGAVWVANTDEGTVSRIDPVTRKVVRTIELGNAPAGIAIAGDLVWVTVREP
jgi:YVTN family beta-propeller protein